MERVFEPMLQALMASQMPDNAREALMLAAWPHSVGELLSDRCRAIGFANGELTVGVKDLAWERHLRDLAPQLLARLNGRVGRDLVRFIKFVVRPELFKNDRETMKGNEPDTTAIASELERVADVIADPTLKAAFIGAASSCLAKDQD
jgi:hypothetical protein